MLAHMPAKHQVRDPDKISINDPLSDEALAQRGIWRPAELVEMNTAFLAAMARAGYEITQPSTAPGTKAPITAARIRIHAGRDP
jgi:hypothetical protein